MAKVLLIDDDAMLSGMLIRLLRRHGHEVDRAADAAVLRDAAAAASYDLVVTDIFMPGIDGMEIIRALRAAPHPPAILAISGGSAVMPGFDPLRVAKGLGADAALAKPVEPDTFLATVARLVAGRGAQRPASA